MKAKNINIHLVSVKHKLNGDVCIIFGAQAFTRYRSDYLSKPW